MLISLLEWIEMKLYKKSVHVVGVADSTVKILTDRGIDEGKISIIKNGVDLQLFHANGNQQEYKKRENLQNKFIVSYIGTHGLSHALDTVLQTAQLMREQENIVFLLVGEGAEKKNLMRHAEKLNLQNVLFYDQIGKNELPGFYEMSDVVLVTLKSLPLFKKVIPSKIFEIMGMSRPILISVDGEARALVEKAGAGIYAEPENAHKLQETITGLMADHEKRRKMGQNGRHFVEQYFDRNKLADAYLDLLKKLIAS